MKKTFVSLFAVSAVCAVFSACSSTRFVEIEETEMKSEKLVINSMFDRDDFSVIDTVSGSSDFVTFNPVTREYEGDSHKYGFIAEPENLVVDANLGVSTGKKAYAARTNALEVAKQNANYVLIQQANELGADTLIEPMYTVESKIEYIGKAVRKIAYKVSVKAKALKIKKD